MLSFFGYYINLYMYLKTKNAKLRPCYQSLKTVYYIIMQLA